MYTVSVEATFCAMHRVQMPDGSLEPLHGHDWRVRARFAGETLDDHGMVVDFCEAKDALDRIVGEFHHTDLSAHAALGGKSPTAEVVARVVYDLLEKSGLGSLSSVEITEAPGCVAAFGCRG